MQGHARAAVERGARRGDALRPRPPQVFQVRVPPVADVRGEKGERNAERCRAGELVIPDDLSVYEHGADGSPRAVREPREGVQEYLRRAVPVAVRKKLRAAGGGKGARLGNFRLRHRLHAPPAAAVWLAQKRRPLLGRTVQKNLHTADRKAAFFVGRKGAHGVVEVFRRRVGDHVEAEHVSFAQRGVNGEHRAREYALLREGEPVGDIVPLRLRKGAEELVFRGHGYLLCHRNIVRLLEHARFFQSEQGARRPVEHARVSRARL